MDVAEPIPVPPEQSIAEQRAAHELDAKLQHAADRTRARQEEKARTGQPSTVREILDARYATILDAIDKPRAASLRLLPSEGDPVVPAGIPETFRRGMVPERFWSPTFAATLETYEPKTRAQSSARTATALWIERALAGKGAMLALIGPQGTGKSHLLYAAANALLDAGTRVYARPWYLLADELRYGGTDPITKRDLEPAAVRRSLWSSKIVLLDEVRRTAGTEFDDMELTKFACMAYDSCFPMLITSNVNPLADVMGAPAASRFTQIVLDGPDARQA